MIFIPKRKNYAGFENEHIRVIEIADDNTQILKNKNRKRKGIFWKCLCKKCNNIFYVSSQNINKTKSCGCSRRYKSAENEIGKQYGLLTVLEIDYDRTTKEYEKGHSRGVYYKCRCQCGNIKTYRLNSIKYGHIRSCGCSKINNPLRIDNLTGKTFGRLTVVRRDMERDMEQIKNGNSGNAHWLCKCSCGNTNLLSITGWQLKSGHTKSCGCLHSEITAARNKKESVKINDVIRTKADVDDFIYNGVVHVYDDNNHSFIVDIDDYFLIKKWYWKIDNKGYWNTNTKKDEYQIYQKNILRLHQLIAERKYGKYNTKEIFPDHLSRDKSDNRKCNLILKSNADNVKNRNLSKSNTSGKTGVSFNNAKNMWTAYITVNYKTVYLGSFANYSDAVKARLNAENRYGFTCDNKVAEYDI